MTDAPMVGSMPTSAPSRGGATVFDVDDVSVYYGDFRAVRDVSMQVKQHQITAFIGPSGCGKSTMLRCFNRMN
ncbi:MAG TPA: phosphate ABC transporter ATP-binding protein, partial [Acidimicrobiaceae bacterium]|nr:phosphate ABC transporter ATP-binding protein [Acidimicrobiaceae bacterium]